MSDEGRRMWELHMNGNVPLVRTQSEMIPIQRDFIMLGHYHHGPDDQDVPDKGEIEQRAPSHPSV